MNDSEKKKTLYKYINVKKIQSYKKQNKIKKQKKNGKRVCF